MVLERPSGIGHSALRKPADAIITAATNPIGPATWRFACMIGDRGSSAVDCEDQEHDRGRTYRAPQLDSSRYTTTTGRDN